MLQSYVRLCLITESSEARWWDPPPAKLGAGPGGPSQAGPDRNQQESGCISNDFSVVYYLMKKCNIDGKTCNCYFFEIDYENIRLMWVFKRFSVSTRPLTKVLIHFSVSQTQIVLDNNSFFHQNPRISDVKGTTKKAEALELFVYPNFTTKNQGYNGLLS